MQNFRSGTLDRYYPLQAGAPGMETVVLLARDTPLPREVDLKAELSKLPQQGEKDFKAVAWFENGEVVRGEEQRRPKLDEARQGGHPVMRVQERIRELQGRYFPYSRAVSFACLNR